MSEYKSKPVELHADVETVYGRLSNFSNYQQKLETLPEELKAKIGTVRFDEDSITITAQPVGDITFRVVEREPYSRVKLEAVGAPVPMFLRLDLKGESADLSTVTAVIDVDIPMMLRPLVGGKMQEAADKFAEMLGNFFG